MIRTNHLARLKSISIILINEEETENLLLESHNDALIINMSIIHRR